MKAKINTRILIALLIAALLFFTVACGQAKSTNDRQNQETAVDAEAQNTNGGLQEIGEGSTVFLFEVTDDAGSVTSWFVNTNEATVGDALVGVGLIDGDVSDFGLMVHYVNGLRADFEEDGAWWAFYIDDEMAMIGVDSADIEEGVTYSFVYTPA